MNILHKQRDTDMTTGNIVSHLIRFAIPIIIGNVLQQLYNMVDSIIVGNFVSKQALAAVGCSGPIINTLIGFFTGFATGAGVVVSQYYGAKDKEKLHETVQTTFTITLILCVVLTAIGVLATPGLLRLMATPDDVIPESSRYLSIYFAGVSGLLLYNIGSGILRAVGDSTHPLYFLIFSTVSNTIMDYLFVKVFNMGIAGAAIATIAAQFMSAFLVFRLLIRTEDAYRVSLKEIRMNRMILGRIVAIGLPSAVQMGLTAIANVFGQSYINRFNSSCMAGWAAYNKLDSFAFVPLASLGVAVTTYMGQNIGAGKLDRAKKGPVYGVLLGWAISIVSIVVLTVFAPRFVMLFNREPEVVEFGTFFVRTLSPFYVACAVFQVYAGALRGAGDSGTTMVLMLSTLVVCRQLYMFIVYRLGLGLKFIALGYPVGWVLCSIALYTYFKTERWKRRLLGTKR